MFGWQQFPTLRYNSNIYSKEPRGNKGKRSHTTLILGQNARKLATIWKPCANNQDGNYNTVLSRLLKLGQNSIIKNTKLPSSPRSAWVCKFSGLCCYNKNYLRQRSDIIVKFSIWHQQLGPLNESRKTYTRMQCSKCVYKEWTTSPIKSHHTFPLLNLRTRTIYVHCTGNTEEM
jgi:hypothetical protein